MKALSIRQPWAWLIVNGHKDIENRVWQTGYRGPLLIHASKGMTQQEYQDVHAFLGSKQRLQHLQALLPAPEALDKGGIVGKAELIGCYSHHKSPWFMGDYGFLLRSQQVLPFRPWRGALSFFEVPDDALAPPANTDSQEGLF